MSPKKQSKELKKRRLAANLSREEVAEAVGCTLASVHDWEEGRARRVGAAVEYITPSAEYREMLADLLGYSEDLRLAIGLALDRRGDGSVCDLGHSGVLYAGDQSTTARKWQGWGTALKPALEPITVARKPLSGTVAANVLEHGTGAINVDGGRVGHNEPTKTAERTAPRYSGRTMANGSRGGEQPDIASAHPSGRWPANLIHDGSDEVVGLFPETKSGALSPDNNIKPSSGWSGGSQADRVKSTFGANSGSAARFFYCAKASRKERNAGLDSTCTVKYDFPNDKEVIWRDVTTALVPLLERATSGSTTKWSTDACGESIMALCPSDSLSTTLTVINKITESTILSSLTRSLISGCTPAVSCGAESGGSLAGCAARSSTSNQNTTSAKTELVPGVRRAVSAMLSKISDAENWEEFRNFHSTVKPIALMRYLVRLVTPPGGMVLDPFCGSGTTLAAAALEGFRATGIERDPAYCEIASKRVEHWTPDAETEDPPAPPKGLLL
jgi:transcriptional regulator with XRE-family HTH domain